MTKYNDLEQLIREMDDILYDIGKFNISDFEISSDIVWLELKHEDSNLKFAVNIPFDDNFSKTFRDNLNEGLEYVETISEINKDTE